MASSNPFPTTAWSLLGDAGNRQHWQSATALNRLIAVYWRPVFHFVRRWGHDVVASEDLTQEFFLRLVERDWISQADRSRGRFRTFLLTLLTRFLADQGPKRAPRQKTFDRQMVHVSALVKDEDRLFEPPRGATPEELFMKQWAEALVDDVRRALQSWCDKRGRPDWYAIFTAHHFPPSPHEHPTQEVLAQRFRCSRDQVRYAVEQTNEQFACLFRAAVAEQVGSEKDVEAEIHEIEKLLGR